MHMLGFIIGTRQILGEHVPVLLPLLLSPLVLLVRERFHGGQNFLDLFIVIFVNHGPHRIQLRAEPGIPKIDGSPTEILSVRRKIPGFPRSN